MTEEKTGQLGNPTPEEIDLCDLMDAIPCNLNGWTRALYYYKAGLRKAKQPSLNTSEPALTVLERIREKVDKEEERYSNTPAHPNLGGICAGLTQALDIIDQEIERLEGEGV